MILPLLLLSFFSFSSSAEVDCPAILLPNNHGVQEIVVYASGTDACLPRNISAQFDPRLGGGRVDPLSVFLPQGAPASQCADARFYDSRSRTCHEIYPHIISSFNQASTVEFDKNAGVFGIQLKRDTQYQEFVPTDLQIEAAAKETIPSFINFSIPKESVFDAQGEVVKKLCLPANCKGWQLGTDLKILGREVGNVFVTETTQPDGKVITEFITNTAPSSRFVFKNSEEVMPDLRSCF